MKKERALVSVKYYGGNNFINASWENRTITFRRGQTTHDVPQELLEDLLSEYKGQFEVVGVNGVLEKPTINVKINEIPLENRDEDTLENKMQIKKRGRPFKVA